MFGLHITSLEAMSTAEAVKFGFIAWGLLVVSIGIIFVAVALINKLINKKAKSKEESKN